MNTILKPLSLRALFLSLSLVLATGLVVESALTPAAEGLSACGTEAAPCLLEPVAVEVVVEGGEYLASTASARQMMRIGS